MVATPWGESEKLREGMLPPGPSNSPEEVAENQRRRLFGAMVASVAERGYWNTRVADLVEVSGVSLRSFYELFADKDACFAEAVEALVRTTIAVTLQRAEEDGGEVDLRDRLGGFAAMAAAQPAATRMCLIECYVAGGRAAEVVEQATVRAEELVRERLAASPAYAELPPEMATFAVALVLEIFRGRLLLDQAAQLPAVATELSDLLGDYEAPTQPLRSAARPPEIRPELLEASDHAERAMRSFEALLTRQSYAETTMEQVAGRAKMSVRTLYANFASREDLILAAIDSAGAQVSAAVLPAYRRTPSPPEGIRVGFGALFGLLAARPNLAHLLIRATYEGGAPSLQRRREALRPVEDLLIRGAPFRLPARGLLSEAILGGVLGLARRRLLEAGAGALPSLAPVCTYVSLAPLLGSETATLAAQGKSYRRTRHDVVEAWRRASAHPQRDRVMIALSHGPLDVEEIARETSLPLDEVRDQMAELEADKVVQRVTSGDRVLFRSSWPIMDKEEWVRLEQSERERVSAEIIWSIRDEIDGAVEAGVFDARPERALARIPIWVDEQGWTELNETLERNVAEVFRVQGRIRERLEKADRPVQGFSARVVLISFEMPTSRDEDG